MRGSVVVAKALTFMEHAPKPGNAQSLQLVRGPWLRVTPWLWACVAALSAGGCNDGGAHTSGDGRPADAGTVGAVTAMRPGLVRVAQENVPNTVSGTAHLTRLLLRDGFVYGANSSSGVMAWRIADDGRLTWESSTEALGSGGGSTGPSSLPRCVELAAHATRPWLYCSAADAGLSRFDLAAPADPVVRTVAPLMQGDGLGRPGLAVVGDALLVAEFERGLRRYPLAIDGSWGPGRDTGVADDVVDVEADGEVLAALSRARGLLHLRVQGEAVTTRGELTLDGPPLGVRVRGQRAVVALGASGVWVVDLRADAPQVLYRVRPPCVATLGDIDGDALAVACSTGAWLYDLRGAAPRVAGFDPARYGVLDVRLRANGRQLVVGDWRAIRVHRVDLDGHATLLDVANGTYLRQGVDGAVVLRNPGDLALTARLLRRVNLDMGERLEPITEARVAPGAVHRFVLPAAALRAWWSEPGARARFVVSTAEGDAHGAGDSGAVSLIPVRDEPATQRPLADGERFWSSTPRAGADGPPALPPPGEAEIALLLPDCALQWGAIEDLAWRRRRASPGTPAALYAFTIAFGREPGSSELAETRARLNAAVLGVWPLRDVISALPPTTSSGEFFDRWLSARMVGGGDFTEVYRLNDGVLRSTERIYRGADVLR